MKSLPRLGDSTSWIRNDRETNYGGACGPSAASQLRVDHCGPKIRAGDAALVPVGSSAKGLRSRERLA